MTQATITAKAQFDAPIENTHDMAKMVTLMRPTKWACDTPSITQEEDAVRHDNNRRASFGAEAVLTYAARCFPDSPDEDWITIVGDLFGDLMHLCDALGLDPTDVIDRGYGHYEPETHGVL